jgi:hypothetical protein
MHQCLQTLPPARHRGKQLTCSVPGASAAKTGTFRSVSVLQIVLKDAKEPSWATNSCLLSVITCALLCLVAGISIAKLAIVVVDGELRPQYAHTFACYCSHVLYEFGGHACPC